MRPVESSFRRPIAKAVNWVLESYVAGAFRVKTEGSEAHIPSDGRLICLFAPHSGVVEVPAIDGCFRKVGRELPRWVTKKENNNFPSILMGDRLILLDREQPAPRTLRVINRILDLPKTTVATAFEGTRFGNPQDPSDIRTLGEMKPGFVHIAIVKEVPILPVVVLGADKILPNLDSIFETKGVFGVFMEIERARRDPQVLWVDFLKPYSGHLDKASGSKRERVGEHKQRLAEELANAIISADPDYPLGPYEYVRR